MKRTRTNSVYLHYFAQFQDASGKSGESIPVDGAGGETAADWYRSLSERYGFRLDRGVVRPAVNGRYAEWTRVVRAGDELAFIPPVAGG